MVQPQCLHALVKLKCELEHKRKGVWTYKLVFPLKSTIEPTRNSPFVMGVPAHGFGPLHFALAEAAYSSL